MLLESPATETDQKWMRLALQQAQLAAEEQEVPVGAVLVQDERLVASAYNQTIQKCDPSAHAEIAAIRAASLAVRNYRLPGAQLYVTLEPCAMCFGAIVQARIARVIFAAAEPKAGVVISHSLSVPFNHHCYFTKGVLSEESQQLIQNFFKSRRALKKALKQEKKP